MEAAPIPAVTREEAQSSLAEIDRVMTATRRSIGASRSGPVVILWGIIWVVGYTGTQFFPHAASPLWLLLNLVGVAGSIFMGSWFRQSPVRQPGLWRHGVAWLILFAYAAVWIQLLGPWELSQNPIWTSYFPIVMRKMAAFIATVPMCAYVIAGLWLDRFFIWLGALVTVATLVGFYHAGAYFYLWMAVTGGGSLIVGGVFIRKFWK
jgi:hypothetical protein